MRRLSYSQISLYQSCPLKYRIQYLDGLKPKVTWQLSFGSSLHKTIEQFYKVVSPPPSLEKLRQLYEAKWLSAGYESKEAEQYTKELGWQILTEFHQSNSKDFKMPLALEKRFDINIEGVPLTGYIDKVDKLPSGGLAVIDYKSNQSIFTKEYVENDLQLTIYQMAIEKHWYLPVELLGLYHLRSNTLCSCHPRSKEKIEETKKLILNLAESIEKGDFKAKENQYCPCEFSHLCPYYSDQFNNINNKEKEAPLIKESIDEYAKLKEEVKDLEKELAVLKERIVRHCQSENITRAYGTEYAVTFKNVERYGYDEESVKELLEPLGLWHKVLTLDKTRLEELAQLGSIEGLKKQIELLRIITSSSSQLWIRKPTKEDN